MKGRRRARRAALQALYELDESRHDLETVLTERMLDFYRSSAVGVVRATDWAWLDAVIRDPGQIASRASLASDVALERGLAVVDVQETLDLVAQWLPHGDYCVAIVRGVWANRVRLDEVIARLAPEWPVEQMPAVDRNVLRIALWEITTKASPVRVAINEAVELARAFSGEGARRMVNGALGAFAIGAVPLVLERDPTLASASVPARHDMEER